MNYPKLIRFFY